MSYSSVNDDCFSIYNTWSFAHSHPGMQIYQHIETKEMIANILGVFTDLDNYKEAKSFSRILYKETQSLFYVVVITFTVTKPKLIQHKYWVLEIEGLSL